MAEVININEKRNNKNVTVSKAWESGYEVGLETWEIMDQAMEDLVEDERNPLHQMGGLIQSIMNGLYYMSPDIEFADKVLEIAKKEAKDNISKHKKD